MQLGYFDTGDARRVCMMLAREPGEPRAAYVARFFREIDGLGRVWIVTRRGGRVKMRARRRW